MVLCASGKLFPGAVMLMVTLWYFLAPDCQNAFPPKLQCLHGGDGEKEEEEESWTYAEGQSGMRKLLCLCALPGYVGFLHPPSTGDRSLRADPFELALGLLAVVVMGLARFPFRTTSLRSFWC